MHSDLPAEQAQELLQRMEKMLDLIGSYWQQPNRSVIECYVVSDMANWPAGQFPKRAAQALAARSGITFSKVSTNGKRFSGKSTVYAVPENGLTMHEVVHAYCVQSFGRTGPVWYSEGMAEMGKFWQDADRSVACHRRYVKYLREREPPSLSEIVRTDVVTGDSWQNYATRWALCHLLANNENYKARFRPLGRALLAGGRASFASCYGSMTPEIEFEYHLFLKQIELGYRVDLSSWDWKTKFRRPGYGRDVSAKIQAARGWQAAKLLMKQGDQFRVRISGTWKTDPSGESTDAGGDENRRGVLAGVVFQDYSLSDAFTIDLQETFIAPFDGKLFLRCRDDWQAIDDNSGAVSVRFTRIDETAEPSLANVKR
jgi:hypothetical protein